MKRFLNKKTIIEDVEYDWKILELSPHTRTIKMQSRDQEFLFSFPLPYVQFHLLRTVNHYTTAREYGVYTTITKKPFVFGNQLYAMPLPNNSSRGKICYGANYPAMGIALDNLEECAAAYLCSPFTKDFDSHFLDFVELNFKENIEKTLEDDEWIDLHKQKFFDTLKKSKALKLKYKKINIFVKLNKKG